MKIQKWDEINGTGSSEKMMEAFLTSETDTYAILQLRYTEETAYERFESMEGLRRQGKQPDIDHYEVVYIGPLLPYKDLNTMLEQTYEKFNLDHPADFRGHSLSVSDIIAIRQNGVVSCHYVDSIGFRTLPELADRVKEAESQRPSVLEQLKAEPAALEHPEKIRKPEERNIG